MDPQSEAGGTNAREEIQGQNASQQRGGRIGSVRPSVSWCPETGPTPAPRAAKALQMRLMCLSLRHRRTGTQRGQGNTDEEERAGGREIGGEGEEHGEQAKILNRDRFAAGGI
jgi:hypothetical protein